MSSDDENTYFFHTENRETVCLVNLPPLVPPKGGDNSVPVNMLAIGEQTFSPPLGEMPRSGRGGDIPNERGLLESLLHGFNNPPVSPLEGGIIQCQLIC